MNAQSVRKILKAITYKLWHFNLHTDHGRMFLQVSFDALDASGRVQAWKGRKWLISPHATRSEVVLTALKAVLTAEEHEAREHFLFNGRAIAGPHIDVMALWTVAERLDVRK